MGRLDTLSTMGESVGLNVGGCVIGGCRGLGGHRLWARNTFGLHSPRPYWHPCHSGRCYVSLRVSRYTPGLMGPGNTVAGQVVEAEGKGRHTARPILVFDASSFLIDKQLRYLPKCHPHVAAHDSPRLGKRAVSNGRAGFYDIIITNG